MSNHPEIANDVTPRSDNESILDGLLIEYRLAFPFDTNTAISVCSLLQYQVDRVAIDRYFKARVDQASQARRQAPMGS